MIINPSELDPRSCYKLLIGSVVPRPIAWTSTVSQEGVYNLAPFSFFTVASRPPPMLCISVGPPPETEGGERPAKDTLSNIEETGECVINIVSLPLSNTMYESSKSHPPEADEFEKAGLTPTPCEVVGAPRVEEAGVSMECLLVGYYLWAPTTSLSAGWYASTSAMSSIRTAAYSSLHCY